MWVKVLGRFVPGVPRPKGSFRVIPRKSGGTFVQQPERSLSWQNAVRELCAAAMAGDPHDVPVRLELTFRLARPKGHFNKSGTLKTTAPHWPDKTPDVDKLVRNVLDGLTGVLYDDDKRVVDLQAWKAYADTTKTGCNVDAWVWDD